MQNKSNSSGKKRNENKKPLLFNLPFKELKNMNSNTLKIQKSKSIIHSPKKNEKNKMKDLFSLIPLDIIHTIILYLPFNDIVQGLQLVNKYLFEVCSKKSIWLRLNKIRELNICEKYKIKKLICERRSKGKVFKAESRLSDDLVKIQLFFSIYSFLFRFLLKKPI
jgi:hypothetical protein